MQTENQRRGQYHWKRRLVQFATLLLIALVPAIGLFRIDLATASFVILDRTLWWSNFSLVFGLAIIAATAPVITYMTIGTVWCGWACPQNLLSEWANSLTHKLLGKRANVGVESDGLVVAAAKNKLLNWVVLAASFLAASLVLGVIPFLFFFSPAEIWSFFTFSASAKLSGFMRQLYFFGVFLIFVDIAVIRYFWCDYACLYRIGQKIFKTQDALHITYDKTRSADCTKCNYCATACITGIQPTNIKLYDSCIDCGECVDACDRLHAKSGTPGLLRFELGEHGGVATWRAKIRDVLSRFNWWVGALFLAGCLMTVWGFVSQPEEIPQQVAREQQSNPLAELCRTQCFQHMSACKGGKGAECFRFSACQCQCFREHDPASQENGRWQQCVKQNEAQAASMERISPGVAKPR